MPLEREEDPSLSATLLPDSHCKQFASCVLLLYDVPFSRVPKQRGQSSSDSNLSNHELRVFRNSLLWLFYHSKIKLTNIAPAHSWGLPVMISRQLQQIRAKHPFFIDDLHPSRESFFRSPCVKVRETFSRAPPVP